jgi:hypothetical protein
MSEAKPQPVALSQFVIGVDYGYGPSIVTTQLWGHDGMRWQELRPMARNGNAAAQRRWWAMSREQRAAYRRDRDGQTFVNSLTEVRFTGYACTRCNSCRPDGEDCLCALPLAEYEATQRKRVDEAIARAMSQFVRPAEVKP